MKETKELKYNSKTYLLVLVAMLASIGPFVTDFYLPAFPELNSFFGTSTSMTQLSLTFCMLGLAIGQIFIGPLSDRLGRKQPLIVCFLLFIVASFASIYAWNIESFIFFRFLQGLAGSGGVVISRSIVVDRYEGAEMGRFFAMLSVIQAIAPILAPVLGGVLLNITDWRGIFVVLVVIEIIMLLTILPFKESLPKERRKTGKLQNSFQGYVQIFRNKQFISFTMIQAFAMGILFAYMASSPFIFQDVYGLSPFMYSLCFGINAVAVMIGTTISTRFSSVDKALLVGSKIAVVMGILVATVLALHLPFFVVEIMFFLMMMSLGILFPTSATLALGLERDNSGSASAFLGFMSFLIGGIASPLTGLGNILYSTGVILVICSLFIAFFTYQTGKKKG